MIDFDTFTKLPKNVGYLGKLIVAKSFKKLSKCRKIAQIWSHWLKPTIEHEAKLPFDYLGRYLLTT